MKFTYESSQYPSLKKDLPAEISNAMHDHLAASGLSIDDLRQFTFRQIMDAMWSFKYEGRGLCLNQMYPMYMYLCRYWRLWDKEPV